MLTDKIKEALKINWGDKANALDCYAEVKLMDPLSSWECYIFAMSPDEQMLMALIYTNVMGIDIYTLSYKDLSMEYNEEGEQPIADEEFRRIKLTELVRRLGNEAGRNQRD